MNNIKRFIKKQCISVIWCYQCLGINLLIACTTTVHAWTVQQFQLANAQAVVVKIDITQQPIQLFLKNPQQQVYQSFNAINQQLKSQHQHLEFAMNAGMYHANYLPVGLYISKGVQEFGVNTDLGFGNFFMQPNGIFLINNTQAQVISTKDFVNQSSAFKQRIKLATQSGPLLVYQDEINPLFQADSASRFIRNAVGVDRQGNVVFVITNQPVNFYELAQFFKTTLGCANALYLDGTISSLYLPALKRNDRSRLLGPIIGIVAPDR